jgi:hypothetical protein
MAVSKADWSEFVRIYNDTESFPTIADAALELKTTGKWVSERARRYRHYMALDASLTPIITRTGSKARAVTKDDGTPEEHAEARATLLSNEITALVTSSKYPVINPEAIVIESQMTHGYDRETKSRRLRESTPRTWLSATLKVEPITNFKGRKFLFTGAQNDTELHPIWPNLIAYAKHLKAEVVVGPGTYETQWWSENNPVSRAYAPEIADYLCFGQMKIGESFVFCGEMNILPTASEPISDLINYTRGRWGVFPHAKRQLKSVPSTDPKQQAHQVMTTGLCTKPKVIPRKAGIKSIFHHVAGAVIVEFDKDGDVFCRHISASEDGSFYDLDIFVSGEKVFKGRAVRYLTLPDVHEAKLGPVNAAAIFGIDIVNKKRLKNKNAIDGLAPQDIFVHDLYDNQSRNHHTAGCNGMDYQLAYGGKDSVLDEIKNAAIFLRLLQRPGMMVRVVESNHDLALERYVREGRYRNDGKNIRVGLQLEDAYLGSRERVADALNAYKAPPKFSVLEHAIMRFGEKLDSVSWIYDGDSFLVDGVECGHHGFRGANGSQGTVAGFARLGRKMSIGDKHSPEINEGVYVDGCSELQHGYNKGPSGWAVSMIVQYQDSKRTLVTFQNGKWRG